MSHGPSASSTHAEAYWNHAADRYAEAFTKTSIGRLWREAVQRELDAAFQPSFDLLEMNSGTGIDAIHLATRRATVLPFDISPRMIELRCAMQRRVGLGIGSTFVCWPSSSLRRL